MLAGNERGAVIVCYPAEMQAHSKTISDIKKDATRLESNQLQ